MQLATKEQALAAHFEVLEGANTWDTSSCLNRSHQHYRILASEVSPQPSCELEQG